MQGIKWGNIAFFVEIIYNKKVLLNNTGRGKE